MVTTVPNGNVRWAHTPFLVSYHEPSPVWELFGRVVVVVGFGRVVDGVAEALTVVRLRVVLVVTTCRTVRRGAVVVDVGAVVVTAASTSSSGVRSRPLPRSARSDTARSR